MEGGERENRTDVNLAHFLYVNIFILFFYILFVKLKEPVSTYNTESILIALVETEECLVYETSL